MKNEPKELFRTPKGKEVVSKVTLKNVKTGFGHDLNGFFADFYLNGKKMGYANDDGWGGEMEIDFVDKVAEKTFAAFLKENNYPKLMFDCGWKFMGSPEKIDFQSQVEHIINEAFGLKEVERMEKKMVKLFPNYIVYGTHRGYKARGWKMPMAQIVNLPKGKESIQKLYNEIKAGLKKDEQIFNDNLTTLGIDL